MKRLGLLFFIALVLVIGGTITSQLSQQSNLAVIKTDDPSASVFMATPDKATALFLMVGFVISNVVVVGIVLALVFWLLDRGMHGVRGDGAPQATPAEATES